MKKQTLLLGLLSLCLFLTNVTFAQHATMSDECSTAERIAFCNAATPCPSVQVNPLYATTSERTGKLEGANCMSKESVDVWYTFQADDDIMQLQVADTEGRTEGYLGFEVLNNACGEAEFTSMYCYLQDENNRGCGVVSGLEPDQIYYLRVVFAAQQNILYNINLIVPERTVVEQCQAKILPLTLTSFTAEKGNKNAVTLDWQTATERNTHHIEVERSVDGSHFEVIATLKARGNSSKTMDYQYIDTQKKEKNVAYYRLKFMDNDLRFEYSNILSVGFETTKNTVIASPNPFSQQLLVQLQGKEEGSVELLDISGRILETKQVEASEEIATQQHIFYTSSLPSGIYLVRYRTNYQAVVQKVVRE
ncbi:MAG: hypothetical protein RLZZ292_1607 [Bacteroidota bacterium]